MLNNKFIKRTISLLLACVVLAPPITLRAEENSQENQSEEVWEVEGNTSNQNISSEVKTKGLDNYSDYFVQIPKRVVIGSTGEQNYTVKVKGDIPADTRVHVEPLDDIDSTEGVDFLMYEDGDSTKRSLNALVTASKIHFDWDEIVDDGYSDSRNKIELSGLTAGSYSGDFGFLIKLCKDCDSSVSDNRVAEVTVSSSQMPVDGSNIELKLLVDGVEVTEPVEWSCDKDYAYTFENINTHKQNFALSVRDNPVVGEFVTVTATYDGLTASTKIEVLPAVNGYLELEVEGFTRDNPYASYAVMQGETLQLHAYDKDTKEEVFGLTWYASRSDNYSEIPIEDGLINIPDDIAVNNRVSVDAVKDGYNYVSTTFYINSEKHEHDWIDTGSKNPTCTEGGFSDERCTICNRTNNVTLDSLGHDYGDVLTTPATCTSDGYKYYYCNRCNNNITETLPATGHSYSADGRLGTMKMIIEDRGNCSADTSIEGDYRDMRQDLRYYITPNPGNTKKACLIRVYINMPQAGKVAIRTYAKNSSQFADGTTIRFGYGTSTYGDNVFMIFGHEEVIDLPQGETIMTVRYGTNSDTNGCAGFSFEHVDPGEACINCGDVK